MNIMIKISKGYIKQKSIFFVQSTSMYFLSKYIIISIYRLHVLRNICNMWGPKIGHSNFCCYSFERFSRNCRGFRFIWLSRLKWFCGELFLFVLIFSLPLDIVYMNSVKYLWLIRNWIHEDVEGMVGVTYRLPRIVCTGKRYCWYWLKSAIYSKCCFLWTWSKNIGQNVNIVYTL